jgi:hypothetical protein
LAALVSKHNWYLLVIVIAINVISDGLEVYNGGLVVVLQQKYVAPDLMETAIGLIKATSLIISIGGQSIGVLILTITNYNFSILAVINSITYALTALVIAKNLGIDKDQSESESKKVPEENNNKNSKHTKKSNA